jgi:hypothetical protein
MVRWFIFYCMISVSLAFLMTQRLWLPTVISISNAIEQQLEKGN